MMRIIKPKAASACRRSAPRVWAIPRPRGCSVCPSRSTIPNARNGIISPNTKSGRSTLPAFAPEFCSIRSCIHQGARRAPHGHPSTRWAARLRTAACACPSPPRNGYPKTVRPARWCTSTAMRKRTRRCTICWRIRKCSLPMNRITPFSSWAGSALPSAARAIASQKSRWRLPIWAMKWAMRTASSDRKPAPPSKHGRRITVSKRIVC